MKLFGNMKTDGLERQEDRVAGTGGFQPKDSDVYVARIDMAYAIESAKGAQGVHLEFTLHDDTGNAVGPYNEEIYVTNAQKEIFFIDKNTKAKVPLPNFTIVNDIFLCAAEMELADADTEEKRIKVWDRKKREEVWEDKKVFTDVLGKYVKLAILKVRKNKQVQQGNDWVNDPEGEERFENRIEKAMHSELNLTISEAQSGKAPTYHHKFLETWKGKFKDEFKKVEGKSTGSKDDDKGGSSGGSLFKRGN